MRTLKMIQADIDTGVKHDPCWCPIGNMIAREYNIADSARKDKIHVSSSAIYFPDGKKYSAAAAIVNAGLDVPEHVRKFINAFDDDEEVTPIEIEVPE